MEFCNFLQFLQSCLEKASRGESLTCRELSNWKMHGMTVLCWLCIMNQWLLGYKFYWTDWEQLLYSLGPHGKILFIEEKRICLGYRHVGSCPTAPDMPQWVYWKEVTSA